MGKSLNGKELGVGITQRKDGLYQARFVNRFGKRQTIYAKSLNEVRQKLRTEQYNNDKAINVVDKNVTLDQWFEIWMNTCKKNCRDSTKREYLTRYKRVQKELGWRKLTSLNLIVVQEAINKLSTDNARKGSKKILVDMLNKAVDTDLIVKKMALQINTTISKEEKKERKVLTGRETEIFLAKAEADKSFYYNLFVLALETGLRVGEICALCWEDVDFERGVLYVRHTLCYFSKDGKYVFEMHDTKTKNGKRIIPLTHKAICALERQWLQKQKVVLKGKIAPKGYENLVFTTKNNRPTQVFLIKQAIALIVKKVNETDEYLENFTSHSFRHTFATRAIESGMNPKTLQKILGHATLQMTMDLYCHVTEDTMFKEMQKFERKEMQRVEIEEMQRVDRQCG